VTASASQADSGRPFSSIFGLPFLNLKSMKKLLTLLFFIPVFCWGQKKDSIPDAWLSGYVISSGTTSDGLRQDTVDVIMLVCDTSFKVGDVGVKLEAFDDGDRKLIYNIPNRIPYLWWQFGYEVRGGCGHDLLNGMIVGCIHLVEISHLDQNKKPLQKNIVVWVTQEIPKSN
jgi:hypothetical protein